MIETEASVFKQTERVGTDTLSRLKKRKNNEVLILSIITCIFESQQYCMDFIS